MPEAPTTKRRTVGSRLRLRRARKPRRHRLLVDAAFSHIVGGGGKAVSTAGGVVTLNLRALITKLANQSGEVVIMRSGQLKTVQSLVKGARRAAGPAPPADALLGPSVCLAAPTRAVGCDDDHDH